MTDEQAKDVAEKIVHSDYDWVANHDLSWLKEQITMALAARERAGYEEGYKKGNHDATQAT